MSEENKPKSQFQVQKEEIYDNMINSMNLTEKKMNIIIGVLIATIVILMIVFSNK